MAIQFCNGRYGQGGASNVDNALSNTFKIPYPDKLAAGCCLFLAINYDATKTISTISDTVNGSWSTTAVQTVTGANSILQLFRFPNSGAADPTASTPLVVTIVFTTTLLVPQTWLEAWSGIATTTPEDGGSTAASQTSSGAAVSCGSFTPTTGDLVLAFFAVDGLNFSNGSPTTIAASSGFTLKSADIGWVNGGNGLPKASTYQIGSSGAVNPGITPTGNNVSDTWNCLAAAFKTGASGAAPTGTYVARYSFFYVVPQPVSWVIQVPRVGRHVVSAQGGSFDSVTDSDGNTYDFVSSDAALGSDVTGQIWKVPANGVTGASPNVKITMHKTGGSVGQMHCAVHDLVGTTGNIGANTNQPAPSAPSGGVTAHDPDITPTVKNSIVILSAPDGTGPVTGITVPSTAVADVMVMGTGNNDGNTENSGDGWGHFTVTSGMVGVSQNVTWSVGSTGSPQAHAVEFLPVVALAWLPTTGQEDRLPSPKNRPDDSSIENRRWFLQSKSPVPQRWQSTTGQEDRPPPPSRRPDDSSIENRRWFLQSPNPVPTIWLPTTGQEDRPPPPRMRPDDSSIENPQWFARSPSPAPTTLLPTTGAEDRPPPPSRRPDDSSIEEPQWFLKSIIPVPIWQPTAGEHDHPPVIKRSPDESTGWFLKAIIQNTTPNQWLPTTGGDLEHPVPPRRTDWAPQWFSPPVPHPNQWLPTTGEDVEHPVVVQPRTDWTPQWFIKSPVPVPQQWLPTAGEVEHPVPPPRTDWAPQWFVQSPNPVPTTWLPTTGQEDRAPVQKRPPDEPGTFFRSPVTVVGIAGMAWWRQTEVYFNVPPPQMDYHPAWDPQFVVQIAPSIIAVYANPFIAAPGPMTSIPGNPPS